MKRKKRKRKKKRKKKKGDGGEKNDEENVLSFAITWYLTQPTQPTLHKQCTCRKNVTGEAPPWATTCSALEAVRNAARARSAKMVVVVVGSVAELPEERQGAISRLASIDKRSASFLTCRLS